ncbi:hypothetical protein [Paenarthrobacter sp. PH39-S1]|uniref:hypothetical protein n=1 Tax=Paenarthrobacter sp. PH39-S1 TaxID=3046204 RepID=UPI0024B90896|nr:hypothetical protein [Paenarthrobacter sp. PH39-S1]MDJ0357802.1 hypothetical protein [Paenarthrobacter sp. PH39-S1]
MVTTAAVADTRPEIGAGVRGRQHARLCAAVALASVIAHLWMGWEHRVMPWESGLMLLMAAACLPCALAVWRNTNDRAVHVLFAMALIMVAVHAALLLAPGSMAGHQHGTTGPNGTRMTGTASNSATMLGVVALELGVAMLAAWTMRRARSCGAE